MLVDSGSGEDCPVSNMCACALFLSPSMPIDGYALTSIRGSKENSIVECRVSSAEESVVNSVSTVVAHS